MVETMNIGLDLDGTLLEHPHFFGPFIECMSGAGHKFFCISSHGRPEWEERDVPHLELLGICADLIDPSLMNPVRHGDLSIKGKAADRCDIVFDDDIRLAQFTRTPVFAPLVRN